MANNGAKLKVGFPALLLLLAIGVVLSATNTSAQTPGFYDGSTAAQLTATREAASHPGATLWRTGTPTPTSTFTPTVTATSTVTATVTSTSTPSATATPTATPSPTVTSTPTPTATPVPLYCPTPAAVGDDTDPCPITLSIVTGEDRYWISSQAAMPTNVSASPRLTGLPAAAIEPLQFVWSIAVAYIGADFDPLNGSLENSQYEWPPQVTTGLEPLLPDFGDVVRGGTLILRVITWVDHQPYTAQTTVPILGRNPTESEILAYFSSRFPSSYYTLWRIAQAESGLRHFTDSGHPKWSTDGLGGVGLMQITNPAPTADEVWSWKRNADAGSRLLQDRYALARDWPRTVAGSREFVAAVEAVDAAREREGLPRLTRVIVPEFTSGNFVCNLMQREQNAVRLYNGAGGTDELGRPLHEFKLAFDQARGLLDLIIDEETGTATAQWVRVPASERPQGRGSPNYVDIVLSRPPPGRC